MNLSTHPPPAAGLYIHFPWCVKKCPYCDFNSHRVGTSLNQPKYIETLLTDLNYELGKYPANSRISSIFMGGGTPSLFSPESMSELLIGLGDRVDLSPEIEITMEANPGTTEYADFAGYRQAGINRLSIGIQSFSDQQLNALGRIHSSDEARIAFAKAREGGFDNINLDLMFALPNQSKQQALEDINSAIKLAPDHISAYQLTLEPDTVFYRYPPKLPSADSAWEIESAIQNQLQRAGYKRYEISAYSLPDKQCNHNLNYWKFGDYIGIGAGAHGKQTVNNRIIRLSRKKHPTTYIRLTGSPESIAESREVPEGEVLFEFLMNALRLIDGISLDYAAEKTGITSAKILQTLQPAIQKNLVTAEKNRIKCTTNGQLFLDSILAELLD